MLLKRSIVLAAGVLLFILAFIIYFEVTNAQMEDLFRQERVKFGVEGTVLTAPIAGSPTPAPAAAAPAAGAPSDSTAPSSPATPDGTPAPAAPSAPDTNAAPAAMPSSTMNDPRQGRSPFIALAAYQPEDGMRIQMASTATQDMATPVAPVLTSPATTTSTAATNATPAAPVPSPAKPTPLPAPATTPTANSGTVRPAVGEASVIVLLFHQFKPAGVHIPAMYQWTMNQDVFESEMKYIHDNGYHVVPVSDVLRFIKHEITLPPGSVAITIDDGYKSAIVYAAPILKKYGYPWTFFIYPEFITTGEGPGAASWNDLLALQAQGVDIECHSMTHPKLTSHHQLIKGVWHNFSPEEYDAWLTNETSGAKALLEQKMGKTITCFAYPYGDYNKAVEAKAVAAGFEAIFTVADNPVHSTTNLHSIGRYTITQGVEKNFPAYLHQSALGLTEADPEPGATTSNPQPVITAVLAPMSSGKIDPNSIETSVRDFGDVRHDFDPQTNTVRLYLPRPLISPVVLVNLRVKDAATGQIMVANWHFNYEPGPNAPHAPITPATNASSKPTSKPVPPATTNSPSATQPEPLEKSAIGTPLDPTKATPH